jgi:hypothetical protein
MKSATRFDDKYPPSGRYHKDKQWDISEFYSRVSRHLVGKPEGKILLGRPRRRWEYNTKMNLQELGWGTWAGLIWLRIGTRGGHL